MLPEDKVMEALRGVKATAVHDMGIIGLWYGDKEVSLRSPEFTEIESVSLSDAPKDRETAKRYMLGKIDRFIQNQCEIDHE